jgi:hypothetical protein
MRPPVDAARIHALGRVARRRVRIHLTGGATAVLEGWRILTIDVDMRFALNSAPGRIRTCDPVLRRHVLYPLSYGRVHWIVT